MRCLAASCRLLCCCRKRTAGQTGHSDFAESTDAVKALTPEEKAAKLARMKELIAARRAARGEEEKVDHIKVPMPCVVVGRVKGVARSRVRCAVRPWRCVVLIATFLSFRLLLRPCTYIQNTVNK